MKKLIVIFFSAALGISFLFIGFGSYLGQSHLIKVGKTKITNTEFSREYDNYKSENKLNNLSEQEELYSKIQFMNQYVNEVVFDEYLNKKIDISENSKKVILKKSLNNIEFFNNLDEANMQNYLKEITKSINIDIFNNSLEASDLVQLDINPELLKEKELNIFEIISSDTLGNIQYENEYFENYDLYEVSINQYDIKNYIESELITEEILINFYNNNVNKYTNNNSYSYEQVISEEILSKTFEEIKEEENIQFKLFENIDEKLILPKVKVQLEKIDIGETSQAIQIGNKYFYIKKIDFNEKIISEFKVVQEIIKNEIIMTEVNDFNFAENKEKLTNYSQNSLLYSNSFNFSKNIPNNFNFINFNSFEGQTINGGYLYDFSVIEIDKDDLSSELRNKFLVSYSNYKMNIDKDYEMNKLKNKGTVKVNYFTDSLTIKGFFISKNDLENVVSIKNDELLKIILPNEVIYLNVKSYGKIDPINIKQNIVNQIYSKIIEQLKRDIEIEVDNEQLLKL